MGLQNAGGKKLDTAAGSVRVMIGSRAARRRRVAGWRARGFFDKRIHGRRPARRGEALGPPCRERRGGRLTFGRDRAHLAYGRVVIGRARCRGDGRREAGGGRREAGGGSTSREARRVSRNLAYGWPISADLALRVRPEGGKGPSGIRRDRARRDRRKELQRPAGQASKALTTRGVSSGPMRRWLRPW
jgi:hypothetical protein